MHFDTKCKYVSFVILWQNPLKNSPPPPPSLWGSKFWKNDQNCLIGYYSDQWHHFEPNPSTQFSFTVFRVFLKIEKMQLMRFAILLKFLSTYLCNTKIFFSYWLDAPFQKFFILRNVKKIFFNVGKNISNFLPIGYYF